MNKYLFYSNYDILQIYVSNEFETPKFVISAPNEIRSWCYDKERNVLYVVCLSGLYKINLDEVILYITGTNNDQQCSETLKADEDCIFIQLEDNLTSLELIKVESQPFNTNILTDDHQILKCPNIIGVNTYESLILVTFQNSDYFSLRIFNEKDIFRSDRREKLVINFPQTINFISCTNEKQNKVFLLTSKTFSASQTLFKHVVLPQELFIDLFTKECDQVQSPVILFCRQDGHVFYSFVKHDLLKSSKQYEVLCDIGKSIVNIVFIKVAMCYTNSTESKTESLYDVNSTKELPALIFISASGKLLLYFKLNSKKCWYSSVINGPILDVCCELDMYLYHTNGNYVYKSKFYFIESENRLETESKLLHDVKVNNIQISTSDSQPGLCLVCQTLKHTILSLLCNDSTQPSISGDLKDILLGIDQKRLQLQDISENEKSINSLIQQLNVASNLMISKSLGKNLILCNVELETDLVGISQEFFLLLKLTNESKCKISSNWSLLLHVKTSDQSDTRSHSVSLKKGLERRESFKIKIPVSADSESLQVFFILSVEFVHKDLATQNLCVPIFGCDFNSLDFLLSEELSNYIIKQDNMVENKIYTAKLSASSTQIQKCFQLAEKVKLSPEVILELVLTSKRKGNWPIQDGVCRLYTVSGNMVSISCQVLKGDRHDNYLIHINSNSCQLLATVKSAISYNLKESTPRCLESVTSSECQTYISNLQEIRSEVEEMKERLEANSMEENHKLIFSVYEKLRKTLL